MIVNLLLLVTVVLNVNVVYSISSFDQQKLKPSHPSYLKFIGEATPVTRALFNAELTKKCPQLIPVNNLVFDYFVDVEWKPQLKLVPPRLAGSNESLNAIFDNAEGISNTVQKSCNKYVSDRNYVLDHWLQRLIRTWNGNFEFYEYAEKKIKKKHKLYDMNQDTNSYAQPNTIEFLLAKDQSKLLLMIEDAHAQYLAEKNVELNMEDLKSAHKRLKTIFMKTVKELEFLAAQNVFDKNHN